jgi:cytochrome c553
MSLNAKQTVIAVLCAAIVVVLGFVVFTERGHQSAERHVVVKPDSQGCVRCHGAGGEGAGANPGIVDHWHASVHAEQGIGCADCHGLPKAGEGEDLRNPRYVVKVTWDRAKDLKSTDLVLKDGKPVERPDIWMHEGTEIVANVSPRTCARCHERETEEFANSRHAAAAQFLGSVDNFLGRYAEGPAAAINGCQQCHGSVIRTLARDDGEAPAYAPDTWPNTGMGRVNADGSWGSCSACHSRHEFSAETARRPENCGKCHMGPDHPQIEIYNESKHGIAYRKNEDHMNLDLPGGEWILGKTYSEAPTCATCHMGAVAPRGNHPGMPVTHEVGSRISWTLRPKISIQPGGVKTDDGKVLLKEPGERRDDMKAVCLSCHGNDWVDNFYVQYDKAVELYNNKYGIPATAIYEFLKKEGILDTVPMNEEMDYVYFEIWHHEGRRARHGASMMGPDYVQWHGFYELSRNFYTHFLPLALELGEKKGKLEAVNAFIEKTLRGEDGKDWEKYHRWTEGLSDKEREAMLEWEKEVYEKRK